MVQKNIFKRTISNPVVQTFLIYISGGWIVLEMTDYFINNYDLNERVRDVLLIIMLAGLPVAIFLTWYFSREKEEEGIEAYEDKNLEAAPDKRPPGLFNVMLRKPWFSIPGTVLFLLIVGSLIRFVYQHGAGLTKNMDANIAEVSLAVLPFTNLTGNTEQEWLIAGQQETLITELSKLSQLVPLRVVGSYTVNAFKNYEKSTSEIAKEINVNYLIEASVMGVGDSINLQIRLIQVHPSESVIWAESFTGDFSNVLKLLSNIADQVAEKMNLDLSPEDKEKLPSPREVNPESYKAYLRGMYHINQLTLEGKEKGLEYLHEAVRIDPGEPFAYAGLALGYLQIAHSPLDPGDALTKAEAAVNQLSKLDTTMAEFYAAMAELYLYKFWEFDKAEKYFVKALQLDPNLAMTHYHYAWALYLFGRMDEAIEEHKLAQKYDPFNPQHTAWLGGLYYEDGRYEDAIREAHKSFEIQKDYSVGYRVLGAAYLAMGRYDEAIEVHKKLVEVAPNFKHRLGYAYAISGNHDEAEKILEELEANVNPRNALGLVRIYTALGNYDEAFRWLAYASSFAVPWMAVTPELKELHDDPRFTDFVEGLNLPN
jgi:tetratricopeptide (TPR) repeat protein